MKRAIALAMLSAGLLSACTGTVPATSGGNCRVLQVERDENKSLQLRCGGPTADDPLGTMLPRRR